MRNIIFKILVLFLAGNMAMGGEYQVDKTKTNLVKFISDAPLEDFEGITDKIDGYIYWTGPDAVSESELYFEVDLNSIDTGIGLRNRHMRENYLETDSYPLTHFTGKIVEAKKSDQGGYAVSAKGQLFIHGVNRDVTISGSITPNENGLNIKSNFVVALTDYDIEVPQIMFLKIDENMKIVVDFYVVSVEEEE